MKKLKIFLTGIIILFLSTAIMAQTDPPPPPGGGHGGDEDSPPGGGAPIGSGLAILLGLGAAYGGKKVFDLKKKGE